MSTYSTSLQIQLIANGDQSGIWGTTTNTNWNLVEQAIAGVQAITMLNADYTLTVVNGASDEARNAVIVASGTNSAIRKIIAPLVSKTYIVKNSTSGGYAITIGGATGSVATVANGTTTIVYCDGTNFYSGISSVSGDFAVSGSETIGGNLTVSGDATVSGNATVTGATTFVGIPSGPTANAGTSTTQLATTAFVTQNAVLTGALLMWPTTSAPTGYLLCAGAAVSRSTYSALFAVIGTTFGAGDGVTTFNLPNYQDRMPIGKGTIAGSIGTTGGSADAIVVSHTHTATSTSTDSGHTHAALSGNFIMDGSYPGGTPYSGGNLGGRGPTTASGTANITTTTTVNSAGSSGTNANMPPYIGINFIIKT